MRIIFHNIVLHYQLAKSYGFQAALAMYLREPTSLLYVRLDIIALEVESRRYNVHKGAIVPRVPTSLNHAVLAHIAPLDL
jgi:hypothetical protein